MTHMNAFRSRIEWRIVSSALLAAMAVARVGEAGQAPAMLAISSPSNNAIVRVCVPDMEKAVEVIVHLCQIWAEQKV